MKGTETLPVVRSLEKIVVLTHVMNYADLLTAPTASAHLDMDELPLVFGRADDERSAGPRIGAGGGESRWSLADRWLSGRHATIRRHGGEDVIIDEGSKNGTFVNGARIEERRLEDGDLIEVGHSLFCYRSLPRSATALLLDPDLGRYRLGPTPSRSPELIALARNLERVAQASRPVLLVGEASTGKKSAAWAIHEWSPRRGSPLVRVECGELHELRFESTLLGDGSRTRPGLIKDAHQGTLFLDEVDRCSAPSQLKLIRILRKSLFANAAQPGGPRSQGSDVRWIAALTMSESAQQEVAPLQEALGALVQYVGHLPPLRRRREDLGAITAHILGEAGFERMSITAPAARKLFAGNLPGNIAGLRQSLVTAARLATGSQIDVDNLPTIRREASGRLPEPPGAPTRGDRLSAPPVLVRGERPEPVRVLYLAANPRSTDVLELGREIRRIQERIRASEHRAAIAFHSRLAVRPDDLQQALLEVRPHIVHFSGHGTTAEELLLEDERGGVVPLDAGTLVALLSTLQDDIRLVVFNACHTVRQAEEITRVIESAIGMHQGIADEAAIEFAASFYRAIGFGRSLRDAFELGRVSLRVSRIQAPDTLQLRVREGVDPRRVVFLGSGGELHGNAESRI